MNQVIEIKCKGLTEDIFDDLKSAIAESPEPHVVDRFLNEQFRFLERFNELVRLDSSSTAAGEVLLTLKKSDLYFGLLAALRTGQFDKVLGEGFIDIDHE